MRVSVPDVDSRAMALVPFARRAGSFDRIQFDSETVLVWRIRNSQVLGQRSGEFRIQSHTSNLLNLVWSSDLKFLSVDAMGILGTSNPPHERETHSPLAAWRSQKEKPPCG